MSFTNPNTEKNGFEIPSNLDKLAIVLALVPFFFYGMYAPDAKGFDVVQLVIGAIPAMIGAILIIVLQFHKTPKEDRIKRILILVGIDMVCTIHVLHGIGILNKLM